MEHVRNDPRLSTLASSRDGLSAFEQGAQLGDQREGAPFVVLRGPRLQAHEAGYEVDLGPRERKDLRATPPAGEEHESNSARSSSCGGFRCGLRRNGADPPGELSAGASSAVGTPVVDLYALTNPQHTPWGVPHRVLFHDVPC